MKQIVQVLFTISRLEDVFWLLGTPRWAKRLTKLVENATGPLQTVYIV